MKGFPKRIKTKQDFKNLFSMQEFKLLALTELKRVKELKDDTITKATTQKDPEGPESEWNTIAVTNPYPKWKELGFKSKQEVTDLISTGEIITKWQIKS